MRAKPGTQSPVHYRVCGLMPRERYQVMVRAVYPAPARLRSEWSPMSKYMHTRSAAGTSTGWLGAGATQSAVSSSASAASASANAGAGAQGAGGGGDSDALPMAAGNGADIAVIHTETTTTSMTITWAAPTSGEDDVECYQVQFSNHYAR